MCIAMVRGRATGLTEMARKRRRRCLFKADHLLFLLLSGVCAMAQQPPNDLGDVSLQDLGKIEVYSASKHMQDVRDAPSSVTVITADEIRKYGYRTLADILQSVRGFYVTYDRDYTFVGVRGFGRLGDWNSRVLVLIDGHRINDNILGQSMIGSEFLVDVDMIERVEIIRGPSSSLYGADAFFAVINVITRKRPQLAGVEVSFAAASYGTYQGRISYAGQYKGIDMMLSGTVYNSDGQTLFFPAYNSPATNNGITKGTDYENYQHIVATISYRGFTLQGLFSARDKGVPTGYFDSLFNDPRTKNVDDHQYFDLSYSHSLAERWELVARTSYDQDRLQGPVVYPTGIPSEPTNVNTYSFRGNWWNGEVQLSRTFLAKHKVTLGSEVIDNLRQDQGDYTTVPVSFTSDPGSSLIWALYGQDEFAITHKLTLSAGLRYDHYGDFGGTTNPRLALIYRLFPPTTLKLLYGSAFRAPEPFEIAPDFGVFYNSDPNLRPEKIQSFEGIVEQTIGQHFKASGSVFQNRITDLITLEVAANNQDVYENSGKAHATGTELELDGHFANDLATTASYSYTNAEDGEGNHLTNSPRQLGKLNLTVPVAQKRLFADLAAQYTSSRQTLAGNTLSGFAVFNVTLLGHTLGKHLDLSASIYNIFDKKYSDPGRPEDLEDSIQQDGRNFRIKLTGRF
jgi:outer membrane receptor for ferrienterochelin and colicins